MSKYQPLKQHLEGLAVREWHTTFKEIERILGFSLPPSARKHQAWWANAHDHMPQRHVWLDAGWRTHDINLSAGHVLFVREAPRRFAPQRDPSPPPSALPEVHAWDTSRRFSCGTRMEWAPLGKVEKDDKGLLQFPQAAPRPGLYCFRVRITEREMRYIGESDNLARRFGHYRNLGPTQETNIRLNARLLSEPDAGAEIAVSICADDAWIDWGPGPKVADLSQKSVRCLLENAAIIEACATVWEC